MYVIERKTGSGYVRVPSGELSKSAQSLKNPGEFIFSEHAYRELKRVAVAYREHCTYRISRGNGSAPIATVSAGTVSSWKKESVTHA